MRRKGERDWGDVAIVYRYQSGEHPGLGRGVAVIGNRANGHHACPSSVPRILPRFG